MGSAPCKYESRSQAFNTLHSDVSNLTVDVTTLAHYIKNEAEAIMCCKLQHTWFPALPLMAMSQVFSLHSKV